MLDIKIARYGYFIRVMVDIKIAILYIGNLVGVFVDIIIGPSLALLNVTYYLMFSNGVLSCVCSKSWVLKRATTERRQAVSWSRLSEWRQDMRYSY